MFSRFRAKRAAVDPKQRMFGSTENALMRVSQQHQGYMKVGEVLHLRGPYISIETLTAVVSRLQRRHPMLRSRLQSDAHHVNNFLLEEDDTFRLEILPIPRKREDHLTFWRREWREREKETTNVGQGLAKLWLLQDPNDDDDEDAPRELVFICEHSICDGLSLTTVAHELLLILGGDDASFISEPLNWPITMEAAICGTLSTLRRFVTFGRFIVTAIRIRLTTSLATATIPFGSVDFPLTDMESHCHTEFAYATLTKEETLKLIERCRQENATVTSAVSSAILSAISTRVQPSSNSKGTMLNVAIGADTRRRCVPRVANHDLSYHVSCVMLFNLPTEDAPTTPVGMWELAQTLGRHMQTSVDAGQVLASGLIMGIVYEKILGALNVSELPTSGVSSWGVLPFHEQYGKWKLTAMYPVINMIRAPWPFALIQTVNGVLTITIIGPDPVIPRTVTESIRDETLQNLKQMIDV